jgi:DNA-binding MarR family transcriptional regulator
VDPTFDPLDEARRQWERHDLAEPEAMVAATSIIRVQQLVSAAVERTLRPFQLTFARYEVLMLLSFSGTGALPVGKIGERLQVHPASVTNAVDRLEDDGLVRRSANPQDGRSVLACITERGRRLAADASDELNRDVFTKVPLPVADLDDLFSILRDLRRAFGDFT